MKIEVSIKNVYGQTLVYPECEKAKVFASMVGQKTLTENNIAHIKKLGFEVVVKQQTIKL